MFRLVTNLSLARFIALACMTILLSDQSIQRASAVGLVYVDADPLGGNVGPLTAFESPKSDTSNLWGSRADFGSNSTLYESSVAEDSPEITQTLTGLTPGASYDVYAVYWSDQDENWTIRAGIASGVNTLYDLTGPTGTNPIPNSTQGVAASLAVWDAPPAAGAAAPDTGTFVQRPSNPLIMLLGKAGTAVADGSGNLPVFIDDVASAGAGRRTWFDGVAYAPAGTVVAATATLNRSTGLITINNPTAQNFDIKAIHIESAASGGLNASTWNAVHNSNAGWTITTPADPPNTPYISLLEENGNGSTISLAPGGGSISFGNVWNKSPYDHVVIWLTMADGSIAAMVPQFTGTVTANTDFNGDGVTNLADFQAMLANMQTNVSTGTKVEAFRKGDTNGDLSIDFADFSNFRTAYNAAHGAGAFNQLLAQVPEPSSLALFAVLGALLTNFRRRRAAPLAAAMLVATVFTTSSRAIDLLDVDINARSNATNTAPGYSAFTLSNSGAQPNGTANVNGYTISLTAVNSSGIAAGAIDDRVRTTPTGTPPLYQIYQDFVFSGTSVGVGGGMDLNVSGGSLAPNTTYSFSLYSFDQGTGGGRTVNWLDGNNANTPVATSFFNGTTLPTTDTQYKFSGLATTDATGKLLIKGRSTQPTAGNNVFLNGFEIAPVNELTLEVNTVTGQSRILDTQAGSFDASYYEIRSAGGSLNSAGWTSLDDAEATPDPVGNGWDEVPASNANILSEVNLTSKTTFTPGSSTSLGNIFSIGAAHDVRFLYAGPNETQLRNGIVKYVTSVVGVQGDYNGNGVVDMADYVLWRNGGPLQNEVNSPGVVDASDYTYWRSRFGATTGSGSGLGESAVPEPASILLVMALGGCLLTSRAHRACRPLFACG
ncbi:MAG TPA: PEP-CTERM sorting domain-containing protein [Lacipirellulaceae bacterium]|jgi:hypothetical protein|nr:PEP-CTERM sorting domain-containing protein [Lacipirellulaceae bacterium]